MKKLEHILSAVTLLSLIAAWFIGWQKSNKDISGIIRQNFPEIHSLVSTAPDVYLGKLEGKGSQEYFVIGRSKGFGGPMSTLIQLDSLGVVKSVIPFDHKETFAFFQKMESNGLLQAFHGYDCRSRLPDLKKIDAASGATYTGRAVISSVKNGAENLAYVKWDIQPEEKPGRDFTFGLEEITLTFLFIIALTIYHSKFKYRKQLRLISLAGSMIILGFIAASMMSIVNINALLMLYLPEVSTHLVWYMLFLVVFLPIIFKRRNYYCGSICPFGSVQEFLGKIGNAKPRIPYRFRKYMVWIPRILAWLFIILALLSNNPGIQNHEIFSTFFSLIGDDYQYAIAAFILIISTFISRPWCNYLCPVRGTTDYVKYWVSLKK